MTLPELLAPAGSLEKLDAALRYGADAVYLGGPGLNLRAAAAHLGWGDVRAAVRKAHGLGRRVYFALNTLPPQSRLRDVEAHLAELAAMADAGDAVDGLIVADPGVLALARRRLPGAPLHLSTQANTMNAAAAAFWAGQGVARVNLARELPLRDLRAIAAAAPEVELEAFVHGAQCLALSGRCLLSAWLTGRSGNRGECAHPCRYDYRPFTDDDGAPPLRLEEALRPGRATWDAAADEGYSQLYAPEDLCLVKYLAWFVRLGFAALKIEGRMKSALYVAQATDVYATALRDLAAGSFRPALYLRELALSATRPLGSGFFLGSMPGRRRLYSRGRPAQGAPLAARIEEPLGRGRWRISGRGRFAASDTLELLLPGLLRPALPAGAYALESPDGARLGELHPGRPAVLLADAEGLEPGVYLRRAP